MQARALPAENEGFIRQVSAYCLATLHGLLLSHKPSFFRRLQRNRHGGRIGVAAKVFSGQ
jgi:hypothetical protein